MKTARAAKLLMADGVWYENEYAKEQNRWLGGLFEMAGTGRSLFAETGADEYVRRLRENWE